MSRNVSESAKGTSEIARNITGVAKAAQDTSLGAGKTLTASESLSKVASNLSSLVAEFNAKA
jgi:methyl-accepting chemotaxis protein